MPLIAYYESFVDQGIKPPPIAIEGLARAFHLGPENIGARMNYAFALAGDGKYDAAIQLAKIVAFDPHDEGGADLLSRLEKMRQHGDDAPAEDEADAGTDTDTD